MEVTKHELPIVLLFASLAAAQEPKPTLSCVQCRTLAESYLNEAPDLTRHLTVKESQGITAAKRSDRAVVFQFRDGPE